MQDRSSRNRKQRRSIKTAQSCKMQPKTCSFDRAKTIPRGAAWTTWGWKATMYAISRCKSTSRPMILQLLTKKNARWRKDESKRRQWVASTETVVLLDDKPLKPYQISLDALFCKAQPKHKAIHLQPRFVYLSFSLTFFVHLSLPSSAWMHDL